MASGDPSAFGETWYAATAVESARRPALGMEIDADVCVVGGGLAGLTAAREIALRGWSVVLLEARRIAWSASGRNTGFVIPGFSADPEALIERIGPDRTRALWRLSEAGAEYVRRTVRETGMAGVELSDTGWLHVSKTGRKAAIDGYSVLAHELGAAVDYWSAERVRAHLRSPLYFSAVHHRTAFSIHPLNYALGLAAAAEAAGVRIFEDTPALEIDPAGIRKRVTTPSARVRSNQIVIAGSVHVGALMPDIAATMVPVYPYVVVTRPVGPALQEAVAYRGAVSDTDLANNHYRVVGGDRLMWSGHSTTWRGAARRRVRALLSDIARAYPQLGAVEAEFTWSGVFGNTVHRMPNIGELAPGLWLLSGFGGHGLNTTAMAGELAARGIVEGDQTWRLFSPFDLVWSGGAAGRAVTQAYAWTFGRRERLLGRLAQRREGAIEPLEEPMAELAEAETSPADTSKPATPKRRRKAKAKPAARETERSPAAGT